MGHSVSEDFQSKVSLLISRNNNLLDILTKHQDCCSKTARSVIKSATGCGCLTITAEKTAINLNTVKKMSPRDLSGTEGTLCPYCKDRIENEIGESLFYLAGLCNALGLSMTDIAKKEIRNVEMLGKYSLH